MKPIDIIPGRKYHNSYASGIEFLGVKKFNGHPSGEDFELILVVITEDNFRYGSTVCMPQYCADGYWDAFYPV